MSVIKLSVFPRAISGMYASQMRTSHSAWYLQKWLWSFDRYASNRASQYPWSRNRSERRGRTLGAFLSPSQCTYHVRDYASKKHSRRFTVDFHLHWAISAKGSPLGICKGHSCEGHRGVSSLWFWLVLMLRYLSLPRRNAQNSNPCCIGLKRLCRWRAAAHSLSSMWKLAIQTDSTRNRWFSCFLPMCPWRCEDPYNLPSRAL